MSAPLWEWQQAIIKSNLESTTRLVLWSLSAYMSPSGAGAFPSVSTIARGSGLTPKSAGQHLRKAEEKGWVIRTRNAKSKHGSYNYVIANPDQPPDAQGKFFSRAALGNVVPIDREPRSTPTGNDVRTTNKTSLTNIHTNAKGGSSGIDLFEALWSTFPRRPGSRRELARAVWDQLTSPQRTVRVTAAAAFRRNFDSLHSDTSQREAALAYVPFLSGWLKQSLFEVER